MNTNLILSSFIKTIIEGSNNYRYLSHEGCKYANNMVSTIQKRTKFHF